MSDEPFELLAGVENPFRGSIESNPWDDRDYCDVRAIHDDVFRTCCDAVECARQGRQSAGIVIHGPAGSGKTHLVRRLRKRFIDIHPNPGLERLSQAFAYVRLGANPSSLWRHVRRQVADDLLRRTPEGLTQFERMVISRLTEYRDGEGSIVAWSEYLRSDVSEDAIVNLVSQLAEDNALSPRFAKILIHLVLRRHSLDVRAWLRGDALTHDDYVRLGVPDADDGSEHARTPEELAGDTVRDFAKLAGDRIPLVLCFDQVEALQLDPQDLLPLEAFGELVASLHDCDTNLVLISCMQSTFLEQVRGISTPHFHRLRSFAERTLPLLTVEEAALIAAERLARGEVAARRPAAASTIWPLTVTQLKQIVGPNLCTPRRFIEACALEFDAVLKRARPVVETFESWLEQTWDERFQAARLAGETPRSLEIEENGLPLLTDLLEAKWRAVPQASTLTLDGLVEATGGEGRVGVAFLEGPTQGMHFRLKRLQKLLEATPRQFERLLLLRDERKPFSKQPAPPKDLDALLKKGALLHRVAPEALAALEAVAKLINDAKSGDLSREGETVAAVSVLDWLRNNLPQPLRELADVLVGQGPGPGFAPLLPELLQTQLAESPMWPIDQLAQEVNRTEAEIVQAVLSRSDLFGWIAGEPGVVFSVQRGAVTTHPADAEL